MLRSALSVPSTSTTRRPDFSWKPSQMPGGECSSGEHTNRSTREKASREEKPRHEQMKGNRATTSTSAGARDTYRDEWHASKSSEQRHLWPSVRKQGDARTRDCDDGHACEITAGECKCLQQPTREDTGTAHRAWSGGAPEPRREHQSWWRRARSGESLRSEADATHE